MTWEGKKGRVECMGSGIWCFRRECLCACLEGGGLRMMGTGLFH